MLNKKILYVSNSCFPNSASGIRVTNLSKLLKNYYKGHKTLNLCAITGTDGKTTTTSIIHFVLEKLASSILIGSNGIYFNKTHKKIQKVDFSTKKGLRKSESF